MHRESHHRDRISLGGGPRGALHRDRGRVRQLKVDVIFTYATPPVIAAKRATSVIPIVFAVAGDPVNAGLVASLARPGGNVTGLSAQQRDLVGKRLELLREIVPGLRRLAIMSNADNPGTVLEMGDVLTTARTLG